MQRRPPTEPRQLLLAAGQWSIEPKDGGWIVPVSRASLSGREDKWERSGEKAAGRSCGWTMHAVPLRASPGLEEQFPVLSPIDGRPPEPLATGGP
jgi:hypothetical protein